MGTTAKVTPQPLTRSLAEIAEEIGRDWPAVRNAGIGRLGEGQHPAYPYWSAMRTLTRLTDKFGWDDGTDVVRYFLQNAGGWRGETATRVKAELRAGLAHQDAQDGRTRLRPRYV